MSVLPLESNPDVMNKFIRILGVPENWSFVDVFGLDTDALAWVPRPVAAVILLFPCSSNFYAHAKEEAESIKNSGQQIADDVFYMKQYVSNTCGTVAIIHSIANNADRMGLEDGVFKQLLEKAKNLGPEERGEMFLEVNGSSESMKLLAAHQALAMEGQTEVKPDEKVNHHFICFVEKDGILYELDGRKDFPINHGPTTPDDFLEDTAKICKIFMERDSGDDTFTIIALAKTD